MDIPDGNLHRESPHCSVLMEHCGGFLMDIPDGNFHQECPRCSVLMKQCGGFLTEVPCCLFRLRNDLYCVEWDVKPQYTIHTIP